MAGEQIIFEDIANAIREKDGSTELMTISQMAQKIRDIPTGGGGGELDPVADCYNIWFQSEIYTELQITYQVYGMNTTITIDWGDGTQEQVEVRGQAGSQRGPTHHYAKKGIHRIAMYDPNHVLIIVGANTGSYLLRDTVSSTYIAGRIFLITFPTWGRLGDYGFAKTTQEVIDISHCTNYIQIYTYHVRELSISEIIFPDIQTINSGSFYSLYGMKTIDFSRNTTVPTYKGNGFTNMSSNYEIIVPDELYNDWIIATNWTTVASKIKKKSESIKYGGSA